MRKKKKTLFFFSLTALFLTVYLSQFSLIFFLLLLIQFFKIASVLTLWNFTFFLHHFKWPNGLSFYFFIFSFFSPFHTLHIKSQKMQANLSWLCFNQFLFFWYPLAKWPLPFASFFSFFFPTCLTSLASHIHLCGLTFVHPCINVVGLLYIIIEEKMNPILHFQTSYSNKPISLCWLLSTYPTSSFNELRQSVGSNMVQCTQHIDAKTSICFLRSSSHSYGTPQCDTFWCPTATWSLKKIW